MNPRGVYGQRIVEENFDTQRWNARIENNQLTHCSLVDADFDLVTATVRAPVPGDLSIRILYK